MGESKAKRRAHASILGRDPRCIYCGERADTIEHMPPRMMFRGKQRPKGLEFPSCRSCNNGTSHSDIVASLIGRLSPDPTTQMEAGEFRKLLLSVHQNVPGLLEEMRTRRAGEKLEVKRLGVHPDSGIMRADGPILTKHMKVFGAKMGLALHAEAFKARVPHDGGVMPIWYSNAQAIRGELPQDLLGLLPPLDTLRMGKMEVSDQFQFSWAITEERGNGLFFASFREAFAVAAITALKRSYFDRPDFPSFPVFAPGDLKSSSSGEII
ncbi:hypothetical protein HPT29_025470 (plasmid) [Microvirga terrae]|uniref:HNH endonuclease n=1 Tax=Microvirga terrae TaxID=2740529 RepID=A0ABY5S1V2_9HYPH|nr:hypothetical protein [Microvirga terrae]UVF22504.1 hypothetical protein HPT29_025470 [Microvirga terrae]